MKFTWKKLLAALAVALASALGTALNSSLPEPHSYPSR